MASKSLAAAVAACSALLLLAITGWQQAPGSAQQPGAQLRASAGSNSASSRAAASSWASGSTDSIIWHSASALHTQRQRAVRGSSDAAAWAALHGPEAAEHKVLLKRASIDASAHPSAASDPHPQAAHRRALLQRTGGADMRLLYLLHVQRGRVAAVRQALAQQQQLQALAYIPHNTLLYYLTQEQLAAIEAAHPVLWAGAYLPQHAAVEAQHLLDDIALHQMADADALARQRPAPGSSTGQSGKTGTQAAPAAARPASMHDEIMHKVHATDDLARRVKAWAIHKQPVLLEAAVPAADLQETQGIAALLKQAWASYTSAAASIPTGSTSDTGSASDASPSRGSDSALTALDVAFAVHTAGSVRMKLMCRNAEEDVQQAAAREAACRAALTDFVDAMTGSHAVIWLTPKAGIAAPFNKYARWNTQGMQLEHNVTSQLGTCSAACLEDSGTCSASCKTTTCAYDPHDCFGTGDSSPLAEAGLTGAGELVSVVDTGLDFNTCFFDDTDPVFITQTPPLASTTLSNHRNLALYWGLVDTAEGWKGHGTHVSGTIAGSVTSSYAGPDIAKDYSGMAPDARLLFVDVGCNTYGGCTCADTGATYCPCNDEDDKTCAYGQIYIPKTRTDLFGPPYNVGARISSNSWGTFSPWYSSDSHALDTMVHNAPEQLFVFAAGNEGDLSQNMAGLGTISEESHAKNVLVVGAANSGTDAWRSHMNSIVGLQDDKSCVTNVVNCTQTCEELANMAVCCPTECPGSLEVLSPENRASFSSIGNTLDGRIRPDVVAPGHPVQSAFSHGSSRQCNADSQFCAALSAHQVSSSSASDVDMQDTLVGTIVRFTHTHTLHEYSLWVTSGAPNIEVTFVLASRPTIITANNEEPWEIERTSTSTLSGGAGWHTWSDIDITAYAGREYAMLFAWKAADLVGVMYDANAAATSAFGCYGLIAGFVGQTFPETLVGVLSLRVALVGRIQQRFVLSPDTVRDVLAPMSGTSMATPVVSGAAALVRQYLRLGYYPTGVATAAHAITAPSAATMKAIIIASAEELGEAASLRALNLPTHLARGFGGFGLIDIARVLYIAPSPAAVPAAGSGGGRRMWLPSLLNGQDASIAEGAQASFCVQVASSAVPLVATLVWTDPAASPSASRILVHDLDLMMESPDHAATIYGNTPHTLSRQVADSMNNVEQIIIPSPLLGQFTVHVRGTSIAWATYQAYSLAITGDATYEQGACASNRCTTKAFTELRGLFEYGLDNMAHCGWEITTEASTMEFAFTDFDVGTSTAGTCGEAKVIIYAADKSTVLWKGCGHGGTMEPFQLETGSVFIQLVLPTSNANLPAVAFRASYSANVVDNTGWIVAIAIGGAFLCCLITVLILYLRSTRQVYHDDHDMHATPDNRPSGVPMPVQAFN